MTELRYIERDVKVGYNTFKRTIVLQRKVVPYPSMSGAAPSVWEDVPTVSEDDNDR